MPRSASWDIDAIKDSPFLTLLTDYMWSFRPNMTVGQLSIKTGLPKQTIWGWIRDGNIPHPSTLDRLSEGTGIPIGELYHAVGYTLPEEESFRRANFFADMVSRFQRDSRLSATAKQALIDTIMRAELGDEQAEHERRIYVEAQTTVDSLPVVHKEKGAGDVTDAPAPLPPVAPKPQRTQRTSPRATRRETPRMPSGRVRTLTAR